MSLLVIMGSGETAPTMIKVHRALLARAGGPPPTPAAVMLDTPFGFQENADDLLERAATYFRQSVGLEITTGTWRRRDVDQVTQERTLAQVRAAQWVFAGPGSPSYALRHWRDTPLPDAVAGVAERGGTVLFSSAAACALGTHAVPVYEIYKVGADPYWEPALDLLGRLTGLEAVVVPHYDNAEGGRHDTRFCYLGERRLAALEAELPDEVGILGVDEHTALAIDLVTREATVEGNGTVTVRRRGHSVTFPSGTRLSLGQLDALLRGLDGPVTGASASSASSALPTEPDVRPVAAPASLRADADACAQRFDAGLAASDVDACLAAYLDLEQAVVDWSADTDVNDDAEHARGLLRSMVVRLGDLARRGAGDPRDRLAPFVDLLLTLRARARADRDFATSDLVRDGLAAAGVEVRDTPDGVQWLLAGAGEGGQEAAAG